jgi:hypothetical protein
MSETFEEAAEAPILFDTTKVREITDTNLVDEHQSEKKIRADLAKGAQDLGDGFLLHDEPVLIQRAADGGIAKITPLSELAGVHFRGTVMEMDPDRLTFQQSDQKVEIAETKETLVPLSTSSRDKLRDIIATRLWKHYATEASLRNRNKYNPLRDGIPDLPPGAPEFLAPSKEMPLIPATEGQVYEWLKIHIAQRFKVIDTKKYGGGTLQDIALRIE